MAPVCGQKKHRLPVRRTRRPFQRTNSTLMYRGFGRQSNRFSAHYDSHGEGTLLDEDPAEGKRRTGTPTARLHHKGTTSQRGLACSFARTASRMHLLENILPLGGQNRRKSIRPFPGLLEIALQRNVFGPSIPPQAGSAFPRSRCFQDLLSWAVTSLRAIVSVYGLIGTARLANS